MAQLTLASPRDTKARANDGNWRATGPPGLWYTARVDSSGSRAARSWDALFLLAVWLSIVPGLERPANAPREALVLFGVPLVAALSIARRPFAPSRGLGALRSAKACWAWSTASASCWAARC